MPSKGLAISCSLAAPSCCFVGDGARAEGIGEALELFITLPGVTGRLGVGSSWTDRASGGSEKLNAGAEGISESE